MQKIPLSVVTVSSSQSQAGTYALILDEIGGKRRIPIIIGPYEAQAIVLELEQIKAQRPVTHDLFKTFALAHNIHVTEVTISRFTHGVFFSEIHTRDHEGNDRVIDSRTSDAIAIALRFKCPIFTYESVISITGIQQEQGSMMDPEVENEEMSFGEPSESLEEVPLARLQKMLDDAILREEYELASQIRDEINRRKDTDG